MDKVTQGIFPEVGPNPSLRYVRPTAELQRIAALPRRQLPDVTEQMTAILRQPHGQQTLKPIQAQALLELGMHGGLFGPIRVGEGKTLVLFMAPFVCRKWRPILLVPGGLVDKTRTELLDYSINWRIPRFLRIESYELLTRERHSELLQQYRPDIILLDECHKARDKSRSIYRRVHRYLSEHPGTSVVAVSGTVTKRSLKDFAHIMRWCLKDNTPLPRSIGELEEWADALDEREALRRTQPGALMSLCDVELDHLPGDDDTTVARRGFRRRLVETPGVVATKETPLDCSLVVRAVDCDPQIDDAFKQLRELATRPDGWEYADAFQIAGCARQMALGFYYRWDPHPPEDWMAARSAWARACRKIIKDSRKLDTEEQVKLAIVRGQIECAELKMWEDIEPTFTPNSVPVWLSRRVVDFASEWLHKSPGIAWTAHRSFALALRDVSGLRYYGQGGLCSITGEMIEKAEDGSRSIIAGMASNKQGRNLQAFNRSLVLCPPSNNEAFEQLLGRTHRPYQKADEVWYYIMQSCAEHVAACDKALRGAKYAGDLLGDPQKLCYGNVQLMTADDVADCIGQPRWSV